MRGGDARRGSTWPRRRQLASRLRVATTRRGHARTQRAKWDRRRARRGRITSAARRGDGRRGWRGAPQTRHGRLRASSGFSRRSTLTLRCGRDSALVCARDGARAGRLLRLRTRADLRERSSARADRSPQGTRVAPCERGHLSRHNQLSIYPKSRGIEAGIKGPLDFHFPFFHDWSIRLELRTASCDLNLDPSN